MPSAKSRSCSLDTRDHWKSVLEFSVVVFMIQSTTNRKNIGDKRHRFRALVSTVNGSDSSPLWMTLNLVL